MPLRPRSAQASRGRAAEAAIAHRGDARAEALERSQPGDVLHVLEVDARLALDVEADPVSEGQPVAEACVERVLEVGVRVDEARDDGRVGEAPALAELCRGPDGEDPAVLDRHGSVGDGRPGNGQHPVC